jgi:hypothetical protein
VLDPSERASPIAGSSLEAHLRRLATASGIPLEATNPKGDAVPKKAETLNAELAKAGVHDKNQQKQVTAWLGIRNDAAHGHYDRVRTDVVELMIQGTLILDSRAGSARAEAAATSRSRRARSPSTATQKLRAAAARH